MEITNSKKGVPITTCKINGSILLNSWVAGLLIVLAVSLNPAAGQTIPWKPGKFNRFWNVWVNPLEFRQPITLLPFEGKVGIVPYGGPGMFSKFPVSWFGEDQTVFTLDSTESEVASISSLGSRMTIVYDIDLVKFNLLNRFLPISVVDILLNVGLRTNQVPFAVALPANWPQTESTSKVAPVFNHILGAVTINYQRSDRWYAYLQLTRGLAQGSIYRSGLTSNYLTGEGSTADWSLGAKWFRTLSGNPRYALGLEMRYHTLDVPKLKDPDELSPIEGLQLRSLGFYFTFGIVFGGKSTSADRGKASLYTGDYLQAETDLQAWLRQYPEHKKDKRVTRLLDRASKLVPYQQLNMARELQDAGDLEDALVLYVQAELRGDTSLTKYIAQGRSEIGYKFLGRADAQLTQNNLKSTGHILGIADGLLPKDQALIGRFNAELFIRQGHQRRDLGILDEAIRYYDRAIAADTTRRVEIEGYKTRLAEDFLLLANQASDRSALILAIESLKRTIELDPRRRSEVDLMIERLEERLRRIESGEISAIREEHFQQAREARNRLPATKPRLGMLVAQVEDVLGPPEHRTERFDSFGANHQLWEYSGGEYAGNYYFENYQLKRFEPAVK
ncbi:hypothetical protein ACFL6E_07475 [Candidatus Neomarinimicrobiota bacterium]